MTDEQIKLCEAATENAKEILKRGDKISSTRCGGRKSAFTFDHWDGRWIVSKSGIDDIAAINIYKLNGVVIDFTKTN